MQEIKVETRRGTLLNGVLFQADTSRKSDAVLICITGIHGNFYSNPFYYDFGGELNLKGIDFIYAQTNDAFSKIKSYNVIRGQDEIIGSWNERFAYSDEDVSSYLDYAQGSGYKHIYLAGHSLGANKVIHYLAGHDDRRVRRFILLSPANVRYMTESVTSKERQLVKGYVEAGAGEKMLPFYLMGWVQCIAYTGYDWLFSDILDNVNTGVPGGNAQLSKIRHKGALLIGTFDTFTKGDPVGFLEEINRAMPRADENELIFIEKTGHTYQQKEAETAKKIADYTEVSLHESSVY